jgi:uncharacterized repeat protein (TIGR01451 family)
VYAQRYASDGAAQGSEFRVNTYTESDQVSPSVAARDADGDFVVAWDGYTQEGDAWNESNVYAKRYGVPLLSLTKSASAVFVTPGQTLTYTLVIYNAGYSDATQALISDTMPAGINFVGPVRLDPPGAELPAPILPTLASSLTITQHQAITLTFPVTVSTGLAEGTRISNTAAITSLEVVAPVTGTRIVIVPISRIYLPAIYKNSQ